jgi:hypothetical protein
MYEFNHVENKILLLYKLSGIYWVFFQQKIASKVLSLNF